MESALPLNKENCWTAVEEGGLEEQENKFQKKKWSKTGKKEKCLLVLYGFVMQTLCVSSVR